MKMGYNVFLTGEAGTGKTHVLSNYIKFLKTKRIPTAICASTGIAATHLEGVTLDSWTGLGIADDVTQQDIEKLSYKYHLVRRVNRAKVLVIDEISMIHGKRFDAADRIIRHLRKNSLPFGGLQVILSGDLFQLPPVSKNRNDLDFIFTSRAWQELDLRICYLYEPRRQSDRDFLKVLNDIRRNNISEQTKDTLSQTVNNHLGSFTPTRLYTHNVDVDAINKHELDKINQQSQFYYMSTLGKEVVVDALKRTCLAPHILELKKGAVVMFVKNNYEKGYVNGTLGKVAGFDANNDPVVETISHKKITAEPASWTITEDNDKIVAQITQHPLRLAWAITVHKSQGMTLDAAEIDLSKSFVEGMGYVALSRVRSLKGLRLLGFNEMALRVNGQISAIDGELRRLSDEIESNFNKLGPIRRYLKKYKYMYKLTSPQPAVSR